MEEHPGGQVLVTPLYGSGSSGALSSLLDVQGRRFLLDCGWNDAYDPALLAPLIQVLPSIDAVLLSHPDPAHLGALPYLVGRHGLQAPIYATSALHKMGQMFMYDQYLSHHATSDFTVFSLDDVDEAFRRITCLKFHQNTPLTGSAAGFVITPFLGGHLLGGALWRLTTPGQEHLVYAVDLNQRRERHLSGCMLDVAATRPFLLISDATAGQRPPVDAHKRDRAMLDAIMKTLRADGNVLIPVDTAGRLLELLLLLEETWHSKALRYPLILLSPVAHTTIHFAKSQLEWMSDSMARAFESNRDNPFHLRHVKLCHKREQVDKLARGGKLVMATLSSLEAGPSRQLLFDWGPNPANLIVLLGQAPDGSAAAELQSASRKAAEVVLRLKRSWRVPLVGFELETWRVEQQKDAVGRPSAFASDSDDDAVGIGRRLSMPLPTRASVGRIGKAASGVGARLMLARSGDFSGNTPAPTTALLLDGFVAPEGAAGPLFPFEDDGEDCAWDPYGSALHGSSFEPHPGSSGMQNERKPGTSDDGPGEESGLEEDEEEEEAEAPSKLLTADTTLTVRAKVLTVDFEGRCDARSLRTLLLNAAPRHLVLLQGTAQGRQELRTYCERELAPFRTAVLCPLDGEVADVSQGSASFQVLLTEDVLAATHMRAMADTQLGWLHACIGPVLPGSVTPELLQGQGSFVNDTQGGVFIGDVRFSELKQTLASEGIPTDFMAGGALLCGGCIAIRRDVAGRVLLQGPLCEDFYRVRAVVYDQYHIC